ncbi:MAG TPA: type II toxin-antitoxin system HicA family toxin [Pyrinomonadaceae bacterium]|nr:type II toxin-antitoxin system HicA family toxin [Pyrinomonadaceae bacterium]
MSKYEKLLLQIMRGASDANVSFDDLCRLLKHLNFAERIRGSHHIFTREGVEEILNWQPVGSKAKAYQVKQVRGLLLKYRLGGQGDE